MKIYSPEKNARFCDVACKEHSESTQKALIEDLESTKSTKIRVNTVGAYKYCVLFSDRQVLVQIALIMNKSEEAFLPFLVSTFKEFCKC